VLTVRVLGFEVARMAHRRLGPGQYLGRTLWRRQAAGLSLTLSGYPPGLTHPWHTHAQPTFLVLVDGDHRDRARREEHDQPALTAVFHPTTEPHATAVGPAGMLGLNLEFGDDWLARHDLNGRDLGAYHLLDAGPARLLTLRLLAAAFAPGGFAEADLHTAALELLAPVAAPAASTRPANPPGWLRRAEGFLRDSFRLPVSLRDAAREAGVHPVHLARVFRQAHGLSVGQYLRVLRLAEAGRLVLQDGCPLVAAAARAGFADQAHFTRRCAAALGCSPGTLHAVRRRLRQAAECCNRSRRGGHRPAP
jgi:AraC family transcriptional regulator